MVEIKRNIALCVVFSIFTCGIYGWYWMAKLNDDMNQLDGDEESTAMDGVMVVLLSIVTCGIFGIYWNYKMGERCDKIKGENTNYKILYTIFSVVGLSIINYCLIQELINQKCM